MELRLRLTLFGHFAVWAKYMTYYYPNIDVVVTNPASFKAAGAAEAAITL